ncbi:MAG: hypothetical protein MUP71_11660 [Candidatus Aminicenantes bacterium]|nr:hypothetical protein [Candidatus Aminicenantes bacterium]
MTFIRISDAVERLKKMEKDIEEKPAKYSRQRIYQFIYGGKVDYIQREDVGGSGRSRPGGRILVNWDDIVDMFQFHPKEK